MAAVMSGMEVRATLSLASLFAFRMLGLFMILPVFSIYGRELTGANATLVGVAIGVYGLTQALLQIPFGVLSDRFGRKPMIYLGLIVFGAGSIVAAMSDTIYGVIIGRALQGCGAIASVAMALLSDVTSEENRTKAMAMVGASIGVSFALALVLGPLIAEWGGLKGLFGLTALLAFLGILICLWVVPTPVRSRFQRDARPVSGQLWAVLRQVELARLDVGVFCLHFVLTASFVVLPIALVDGVGLASKAHWAVYLPVLLVSFITMLPFMIMAEKKRRIKGVFLIAIALLTLGLFSLSLWNSSLTEICIGLFIFFLAFNLLEAMLPSLVSKISPPGSKGAAMGAYSSSQFFGAFAGGVTGGYVYGQFGLSTVYVLCGVLSFCWLLFASGMKSPGFYQSYLLDLHGVKHRDPIDIADQLLGIQGVEEAVVVREEGAAYLKVDNHRLDKKQLQQFARPAG